MGRNRRVRWLLAELRDTVMTNEVDDLERDLRTLRAMGRDAKKGAAAIRADVRGRKEPPAMTTTDRFWRLDAACAEVDPELFFPDGTGDHGASAKRVCAGCSVRPECDALAVAGGDMFGVFGGRTAAERTGGSR